MTSATIAAKTPIWFWVLAVVGLAWNLFGAVRFFGTLGATPDSLQAQGMTAEQAAVMLGYPAWMTIAFAFGVFGGIIGCVLLLLRNKLAFHVFLASLLGYIVLYVGDITEGVFKALGTPQVVVLTIVVLIAAGLLWLASHARRRGLLA